MAKKRPGPAKIEFDAEQVEKLAGYGLTQDQIADWFGASGKTLRNRLTEDADLVTAYRRGLEAAGRIRGRVNKDFEMSPRAKQNRAQRRLQQKKNNEDTVRERRAFYKRYYRANREEWVARTREWQANNPLEVRAIGQNRRARERDADGSFGADDVRRLYAAQKGKCLWCGKPVGENYHVDHIIPLVKGGANHAGNICIACPPCNLAKGQQMPSEFAGVLL